jgi:hypothetical protein
LAHVFLDDGSTLTHVATLGAPDAAEDDEFGYAVAVDGATIVVGAPGDDDAGTSSGSAYIYQGASFVAKLTASDAAANHSFGRTVAIDGDTVVIGWGGLEAVYVFERHHGGPNNWGEVKKLTPPEPSLAFGWAVAISGDLIVVGAPYDANDVPYGGAAHIFERDEGGPGQWGRIAKIILDPPDAWSLLGRSVSIDGSTVILGRDTGDMNGAAHIYERDQGGPDQWGLVASLFDFSDPYGTIKFGWSVSIRGDIAVAGAPSGYDGNCDPGTVYVYQRDHGGPDNWGRIARMSDPDMWQADYLGHSVSIDGARVVMGAPGPSFSCCSDCPGWARTVFTTTATSPTARVSTATKTGSRTSATLTTARASTSTTTGFRTNASALEIAAFPPTGSSTFLTSWRCSPNGTTWDRPATSTVAALGSPTSWRCWLTGGRALDRRAIGRRLLTAGLRFAVLHSINRPWPGPPAAASRPGPRPRHRSAGAVIVLADHSAGVGSND